MVTNAPSQVYSRQAAPKAASRWGVSGVIAALVVAALTAGGAGCGEPKQAAQNENKPKPAISPSPKASPVIPIQATVRDLTLTITDAKGVRVAVIKAKAGTVGPKRTGAAAPQSGDAGDTAANTTGALVSGVATLYQNGKPAATLSADRINADRAAQTVTGDGNVRVQSLAEASATTAKKDATPPTTARADTATWTYNKNKITGRGNVVIARGSEIRVPGDSFEADTAIRTFTIQGSGAPATGTF